MRSRPPVPAAARAAADLAFDPVPRKQPRHDGWTPARQKAFVEALADTGCVRIAARMVNMSPESAYLLRRQPGAEGFRRAWEAAQGLGLQVVKDEAFHRAMHGQLVPVFVAGKLMGFRRKKNDRLLMFILRHYGQDAQGRKTTVNYFSTRATASAGAEAPSGRRELRSSAPTSARDAGSGRPATGEAVSFDVTNSVRDVEPPAAPAAHAAAEAAVATVRTIVTGPAGAGQGDPCAAQDEAAAILERFEGVALDAQAKAEIYRALEAAAERRRAHAVDHATPRLDAFEREASDPECDYVGLAPGELLYAGELESGVEEDPLVFRPAAGPDGAPLGEHRWESLGEGGPAAETDRLLADMAERRAAMTPEQIAAERAGIDAEIERTRAAERRRGLLPASREPDPDAPALDWRNWAEGEAGGPVPSAAEGPVSPRTGRPLRRYRKRIPKPSFTPPDQAAETRARAEVEAARAGQRKPVDRRRREHRKASSE